MLSPEIIEVRKMCIQMAITIVFSQSKGQDITNIFAAEKIVEVAGKLEGYICKEIGDAKNRES